VDKKIIIIIIATVCLMAAFLCGYDLDRKNQMKIISLDNASKLYDEKKDISYSIDSIQISNRIGNITGWAVVNGIDSIDVKPNIMLKDENGKLYKLDTRIIQRKDITKCLNDKRKNQEPIPPNNQPVSTFKYDNSGITSQFNIDDLKKKQRYKIGIQVQINKVKYFTWTDNELVLE
jgi:hypothetical protein